MNNPPSPPERPSQPGVNHVLDRLGPLQEPITIGEHPVHFAAKPSGTTTVVPVLDPASAGFPVQFGKYTLLRKLAMGGMAELFLALQRSVAGFEKLVVIKRILPAMNQDEGFIGMLLHEARIAATLSHPNIVQTFDVGEVEGTYFITMEHVHGEDLRSIVRQIRRKGGYELRLEHAISILIGVCAGLAYAHERRDLGNRPLNIVHRDISPQNVVVAFTGDVKVVDFGIAQSEGGFGYETRSGKLKGKVPYMSPEHARGEVLDSRSDIFAVGIMLFELTTGRRLFKGPSEYETMRLICEGEYPRPSSLRATYPPALEAIVLKALARPREDRFQSAREMQAALEQFARDEHLPLSTIALSEFMSSLFEEKLASQEEALRQGKQLADIIAAQMASDGAPESEAPVITGTGLGVLGIQGALSAPRTPSDAPVAVSTSPSVPPGRTPYRALWGWTLGTAAVVAAMVGMAAMRLQRPTPSQASTATAATSAAFGAIHLETEPPGASIWLNGDLRPEKTPATLSQLPVDTALAIKVTKEGFEQERATLSLTGAKPEEVRLALKPETFALTLHISPEGLHPAVTVDGKPILGDSVDHLLARDSHVVVVSAPGYLEQTVQVSGLGAETKAMDIALQKVPESKAPPSVRPAQAAALQAPHGPALNGKLHVSAFGGWCQVSVDGVPKGPTPIAGMELSAGPHRVTCTQEGKAPVTNMVNVVADSTVRFRFDL